jgi:RNA polymerase sigma-70 factor, ECF subfamily
MDRAEQFSDLYRGHYEAVLRYALRRTDPETARDIAAETFLVAWRRLDAVPADPGQSGPWLYGVARLVLANSDRSRRRVERVTARLGFERWDDHASDAASAIAESAGLRQALATLAEADQEALRLVGWEDLDLAGAALAMGCSRSTMAVRLHRARRRLERALAMAEIEEPGCGQEGRPADSRSGQLQKVSEETP